MPWKGPTQEAAAEEKQKRLRLMRQLLSLPLELFKESLRLQGMPEDTPEWEAAFSAWREHQQQVHGL